MTTKRSKKATLSKTAKTVQSMDTTEFDRELVAETFGPPSPAQRAELSAARRKPGRPKEGRGSQVVSVSIERGLLEQSDALATRMGVSRAGLIARGLKAVLAAQGEL